MCNDRRFFRGGEIKKIIDNGELTGINPERIAAEVAFLSTEEFWPENEEYDFDSDPFMEYYDYDTEVDGDVF